MAEEQTTNDRSGSTPLDASDFSTTSRRPADGPSRADALHVCPDCDSELVYPVDWAPASRNSWNVELRCPDCEWLGGGIYGQELVDQFDEQLDVGTEQLLADLTLLTRANMEEQVENFVTALHAGWILPEDF